VINLTEVTIYYLRQQQRPLSLFVTVTVVITEGCGCGLSKLLGWHHRAAAPQAMLFAAPRRGERGLMLISHWLLGLNGRRDCVLGAADPLGTS
jgi:hypothetical protein